MINNRDLTFIKAFGENLKLLRLQKGLSQEQLSYKADISKNQIGNIERGEVNVTLSTIKAIADALQISPRDLLSF